MNNRNVNTVRIAKIKNTSFSLIANAAMQVTTAHDQRYSTFKMAAEVIENIRDKKKKTRIHFPEAVSKLK